MKASRRARKSARAKKSKHANSAKRLLARVQQTPGAAIVIVAAIVFIGTAALMSAARTPVPSPAPRSSARIDTAAVMDDMPAEVTPIERPAMEPRTPDGVTIVGCLTRDADAFKLTDTVGDAAPKARSWKSGFLRKRSASVDLVSVPKALRLPNYVGQRVSVNGTLDDRELHVRSVRRVAASCNAN